MGNPHIAGTVATLEKVRWLESPFSIGNTSSFMVDFPCHVSVSEGYVQHCFRVCKVMEIRNTRTSELCKKTTFRGIFGDENDPKTIHFGWFLGKKRERPILCGGLRNVKL